MAQKRMFSLAVVDTDRFMDMPVSTQALYFHLGMHGDDDGFVASPRKIARSAGCNDDDLRLLIQKQYIIPFESGVIVISDWNTNNTLKNDRYKPTVYQNEKALLSLTPAGHYVKSTAENRPSLLNRTNMEPVWNQPGTSLEPQHTSTSWRLPQTRRAISPKRRTALQTNSVFCKWKWKRFPQTWGRRFCLPLLVSLNGCGIWWTGRARTKRPLHYLQSLLPG